MSQESHNVANSLVMLSEVNHTSGNNNNQYHQETTLNEDIRMRKIADECTFMSLDQIKVLDSEICNEINFLTNIDRLCCMIGMGYAHAEPAC